MGNVRDEVVVRAEQRGRKIVAAEPRAQSARYDRKTERIIVELTNGCGFAFPARLGEGLEHATDAQLSAVEILGVGYGLRWDALDVDLSLPGLMAGALGTRAYMDRLRASQAGRAKSKLKAAAARRNGQKGGRPRKSVSAR
jgi:hypothetical protein